jgi:hypothetical protein
MKFPLKGLDLQKGIYEADMATFQKQDCVTLIGGIGTRHQTALVTQVHLEMPICAFLKSAGHRSS